MGSPVPSLPDTANGLVPAVKTLVVTDLVDSTKLLSSVGDRRGAELSAHHERLARDLLVECGGREIDKTDGFLLLFDRTADAVRYALAYHRALAALSEEEGLELTARVGLHLGEVFLRSNPPDDVARGAKPVELEGFAKMIAARVMGLAKGRQTLITRAAFDLARQSAAHEKLADDPLRWLAHGPYVLKGIAEPVEVFEVGVAGFAPLIVPKSTVKARRAVPAGDEITLGWRPAPGLEVPRRAGWVLVEKLGEGGFGEVWLARHEKTGEARVFKFCYQAERLRSLQREVTLFRLLKETLGTRDDIARILEWNFERAPYFLECEYTEGGNLLEWAAEQGGATAVPLATRLELLAQVADALAAAHSVGVLHKDVKPANVLITTDTQGRPKVRLTDFGIGLITDRELLSRQGITVFDLTEMVADSAYSAGGTHLYMAPELVEGRAATVQADVYALGVMLYQFVVGDFTRALAPGWRRDVEDDILREDIAQMAEGRPERRLRDAQEVAERLRTLDQRRAQREAEDRARREREAERLALDRAHRRRRAALVIAGIAVVVLAVVSFLAVQAVQARREAERRRGQAESLIGFMVGDLRKKLEPIGRLDVLDDVGDHALQYFDAVPESDLTDEEVFRRSQALFQIGEVRTATGELSAAQEAYQESLVLAERLVERSPYNTLWKKALGASHFGVGSVLWRQGDLQGALKHFRAYLHLSEELAAQQPDNSDWVLEKAYGLSNVGSVEQALGNLEAAREAFSKSLELRESLVSKSGGDRKLEYDLAVAHNKLGVVLDWMGEPRSAYQQYLADLRLSQELLRAAPSDADVKHHLATAQWFLGDLLQKTGEGVAALAHFDAALTSYEELSSSDPSNTRWRRNMAAATQHIGQVDLALGEPAKALDRLRTAEATFDKLSQATPADARLREDLAKARLDIGAALLRLDRSAQARRSLQRGLEIVTASTPVPLQEDTRALLASKAHRFLGSTYAAEGQAAVARREWRLAAELVAPLAQRGTEPEMLNAWILPKLLLGETAEVHASLQKLLQMNYRDPELMAVLRSRGLPVPEPLSLVGQ